MARLVPSKKAENKELLILILLAAAEARHFLGLGACNLEEHQRGYDDMSEEDASILDRAQSVLTEPGEHPIIEQSLLTLISNY